MLIFFYRRLITIAAIASLAYLFQSPTAPELRPTVTIVYDEVIIRYLSPR